MTLDAEQFVLGPIHDHCPTWCGDGFTGGGDNPIRDALEDDHCEVHQSRLYGAGDLAFVCLERPDIHGRTTPGERPDPYVVIWGAEGDDGDGVPRLDLPVSVARSLARILTHLADMEELGCSPRA